MIDEPIESTYFNWLCAKIMQVDVPTPSLEYWKLLRMLHSTEFIWLLSGDDNRAEDGVDLRTEFLRESYLENDQSWADFGCSVLELLIAFSRRAAFETEQSAKDWFWEFLYNLGLSDFNDAYNPDGLEVDECLQRFVWRTYDANGRGGLFPLDNPKHDQRQVEIWYQFCEWLLDQDRI